MEESAALSSIEKLILSQPIDIPVFHEVALHLQQMMNAKSYKIEDVIRLVNEDSALAATMLKYANSSYNSGKAPITTIKGAIVRLGSQQIVNLAFTASMASITSKNPIINTHIKQLWHHSHIVAMMSAWFAVEVKHEKKIPEIDADEVYMAGLLHDIGKLYLLKAISNLTDAGAVTPDNILIYNIINRYSVNLGATVLNHWNIPQIYIDAVLRHTSVNWKCGSNDYMIAAVRLACTLDNYVDDGNDISIDSCVFKEVTDELELIKIDNIGYVCEIVKAVTS